MAILDTFYILFKGDSSDAERAMERMNRSTSRLDSQLNRVARRWLSLYAVINQVTGALKHAFDLTQASDELGVNTSALQAWGGAVEKTGGSLNGFTKSIESLAEHLGTTTKIAMASLPELASQFEKLNKVQAIKYGKILGLDLPTILLLQKGRAEVDALLKRQKELGVITEKDAGAFRRFRSELQDTGHGLEYIFLKLFLKVIPYLEAFLKKIQDFTIYLQKHSGLIKGALIPIAGAITLFVTSLVAANPVFYGAIVAFGLLSAAIALVYDDIQTFQRGGKSITGELIQKFPELANVAKQAFEVIKGGFKVLGWILNTLLSDIEAVLEALKLIDKWITPYLDKFINELKIEGKDIDPFRIKKTIETVNTNPLGSPAMKSAISSMSNKNTTVNISDIQVNTQATDATQIAYGLSNALQDQFRQALNQNSGGVLI